ncbi:MAG: hypothetical protein IJ468_07090 [Lachnospiraceae bacterium]|nr:hypothetical protein [Lachnospiraceae bacterium]
MREEKLKSAWDDVQMTRKQEDRIWRHARAEVHKKMNRKGKHWRFLSIGSAIASCMILAAVIAPMGLSLMNQQSVMAEYPIELPESEPGAWKHYALIHSAKASVMKDVNHFTSVISVNEEQKEIKLTYVPHHLTLVSCNEGTICTSAVTFMGYLGGLENVTEYLGTQLNLPLEGSIALNDDARELAIDLVDGVTVDFAADEVSDYLNYSSLLWNPQKELETYPVADPSVKPWMESRDGYRTVYWCDEYFPYRNQVRDVYEVHQSARCIEVIVSVFEEMKEMKAEGLKASKMVRQVIRNLFRDMEEAGMETDLETEQLIDVLWQAVRDDYQVTGVCNLSYCDAIEMQGIGCFVADWTGMLEYVAEFLYGEPVGNEAETAKILEETYEQYQNIDHRGNRRE